MSETHLPDDPAEFDVLAWMATGSVVRRTVEIVADQAAMDRAIEIDTRLRALGVDEKATEGDGPLDAESEHAEEIDALLAEAEALADQIEASKSVWTVRAIGDVEVEAAAKAVPPPRLPVGAPQGASEQQQQKANDRMQTYLREARDKDRERKLHHVAAGVVSVARGEHVTAGPSVEGLRQMRDGSPYGAHWIERLWVAIQAAAEENVEVPRPTSPRRPMGSLG